MQEIMLKCVVIGGKKPDDFGIATEKQYSVKFFVERCFKYLGIKINGVKFAKSKNYKFW